MAIAKPSWEKTTQTRIGCIIACARCSACLLYTYILHLFTWNLGTSVTHTFQMFAVLIRTNVTCIENSMKLLVRGTLGHKIILSPYLVLDKASGGWAGGRLESHLQKILLIHSLHSACLWGSVGSNLLVFRMGTEAWITNTSDFSFITPTSLVSSFQAFFPR